MTDTLTSEGIYYRKPSIKNSTRKTLSLKRKNPESDTLEPESLCVEALRTFEEPSQTIHRRLELYNKYKQQLRHDFLMVQEKYNEELNTSFAQFMKSSLELATTEDGDTTLAVGVIESCLSTLENSAMFDFLDKKLRSDFQSSDNKILVARVESATSSSTKNVFQHICAQIILPKEQKKADTESGSDEEEDTSARQNQCFSVYDFKSFLTGRNCKIVVLVEDSDHFSNSIISQLLTLFGCAKLPVIFVFGAAHGHFVDNLIPLNNLSQYKVSKIYSVSPAERLDDFMKRVLFNSRNPFRVSGQMISFLERLYEEENFSIESICDSLMLCLRYHFLSSNSAFCSLEKSDTYSDEEKRIWLELVANEASNDSPRKRVRTKVSLKADNYSIDLFVQNLERWILWLRIMFFINMRLPDFPLGNSCSKVYISCCQDEGLLNNKDAKSPFELLFTAITASSKHDFCSLLQDCITNLKTSKAHPNIGLVQEVALYFEEIQNELEEKENQKQEQTNDGDSNCKTKPVHLKQKNLKLKDLQKSLLEEKRKKDGTSAIHNAKTRLVDYLKESIKKYLPPVSSLPKAFVYSDLHQLVNTMFPANFLKLNEDLVNPGFALKCKCCSSHESSSDTDSLPDVCILHKLISEHTTKKVDLNHVYQAFHFIVKHGTRKSKSRNNLADASYLIRFRRGIGELQHMGFLKRSKSKPDEITKLTWW